MKFVDRGGGVEGACGYEREQKIQEIYVWWKREKETNNIEKKSVCVCLKEESAKLARIGGQDMNC